MNMMNHHHQGPKPALFGANRKPAITPGGFTTKFNGNSKNRPAKHPRTRYTDVIQAANEVLQRRPEEQDTASGNK